MKATELRIGNYVTFTDETKTIATISPADFAREFHKGYHFDGYELIPLTDEWLVKLGMVKYEGWDDTILWRRNEDEMIHERFELMETIQGYESPSGKIIESVHILQNAYYFHTLTGEELTTI